MPSSDGFSVREKLVLEMVFLPNGSTFQSVLRRAANYLGLDLVDNKNTVGQILRKLEEKNCIRITYRGAKIGNFIELKDARNYHFISEQYLQCYGLSYRDLRYAMDEEILSCAEIACHARNISYDDNGGLLYSESAARIIQGDRINAHLRKQGLKDYLIDAISSRNQKQLNNYITSLDQKVLQIPSKWLPWLPIGKNIEILSNHQLTVPKIIERGKDYSKLVLDSKNFTVGYVNVTESSYDDIIKHGKILGNVSVPQYVLVWRGEPRYVLVVQGTYGARLAAKQYAKRKLSNKSPYEVEDEGAIIQALKFDNVAAVVKFPQNLFIKKKFKDLRMQVLPSSPQVAIASDNFVDKNPALATRFSDIFREAVRVSNVDPLASKKLRRYILSSIGEIVEDMRDMLSSL